jgi:hypothetical protein
MTQEQANWDWIDARVKKLEEHCFSLQKELTEREIDELAEQYLKYQIECSGPSGVYDFARAILREAQRK